VEGAVSKDIFNYLFWRGSWKILIRKREEISPELFKEWDAEHLKQIDEDFEDYPDNDDLKNIIGDEGMQNINNED